LDGIKLIGAFAFAPSPINAQHQNIKGRKGEFDNQSTEVVEEKRVENRCRELEEKLKKEVKARDSAEKDLAKTNQRLQIALQEIRRLKSLLSRVKFIATVGVDESPPSSPRGAAEANTASDDADLEVK